MVQQGWHSSRTKFDGVAYRLHGASPVAGVSAAWLFKSFACHKGMHTLRCIIDKPVAFILSPDMVCPDLCEGFDLQPHQALSDFATVEEPDYLQLTSVKQ